jgi:hypothetical protein
MNKYKIIPSSNYAAFTNFIYNKIKTSDLYDYTIQHKSCNIANEILEESEEVSQENNNISLIAVEQISNEYLKEFTELLNLKENYYIIFTD